MASYHLLSIGLVDRSCSVPINFEVDEGEEMRHVMAAIAEQQKTQSKKDKRRLTQFKQTGEMSEEAELELELQQKSMRSQYQRQIAQQRLDDLVPFTFQRILSDRCEVGDIDRLAPTESPRSDQPFYSNRPASLQLRAYLLSWSILLDLLSESLPSSEGPSSQSARLKLSSDKSSLLVSYLRESDLMSPFASELVEHILISLTENEVAKFVLETIRNYEHTYPTEEASQPIQPHIEPSVVIEDEDEDGNIIQPSKSEPAVTDSSPAIPIPTIRRFPLWSNPLLLYPNEPLSDVKILPYAMKRLVRIRKLIDDGTHVDEHIYYGHLASVLFLRTLRTLPAVSRSWFITVDRSNGTVINRLTALAFTPLLVEDELINVSRQQSNAGTYAAGSHADHGEGDDEDEQFLIRTNYSPEHFDSLASSSSASSSHTIPGVVYAKFIRGEISMGLSLRFPPTYPLLPLSVQLDEKVAIKEEKSRKWTLAIANILNSADGSIWDAIHLWKKNLDQHFAGVEPCTICYSILAAQNQALPRMRCHECGNKFHSSCLYKWFASSGNSKCPLCRALFSG